MADGLKSRLFSGFFPLGILIPIAFQFIPDSSVIDILKHFLDPCIRPALYVYFDSLSHLRQALPLALALVSWVHLDREAQECSLEVLETETCD